MASPFSYRLKMTVEPACGEIISQIVGIKNVQEFVLRLGDQFRPNQILYRRYDFTEFFDSCSGLTTRFQRTHTYGGPIYAGFVSTFRDAGHVFGRDDPLMSTEDSDKLTCPGIFGPSIS